MNEILLPPPSFGPLYTFEIFHMIQNGEIVIYEIKTATEYVMSDLEVPNIFFSTIISASLFV
jgi:hypothetical protein